MPPLSSDLSAFWYLDDAAKHHMAGRALETMPVWENEEWTVGSRSSAVGIAPCTPRQRKTLSTLRDRPRIRRACAALSRNIGRRAKHPASICQPNQPSPSLLPDKRLRDTQHSSRLWKVWFWSALARTAHATRRLALRFIRADFWLKDLIWLLWEVTGDARCK
jgi:hypothetical protein